MRADVYAEFLGADGAPRSRVLKLLSEDPSNYPDAPREGIRRVLEAETGAPHPRGAPLDTSRVAAIRMGTTVGPCCAVLCCDAMCCAVPCRAVLCCAVLCCAVPCCAVPSAGSCWPRCGELRGRWAVH